MLGTQIRTLVLALLAVIGLVFPGRIPEGAREQIAEHATVLIGAVCGLWALFAAHRAQKQRTGDEP